MGGQLKAARESTSGIFEVVQVVDTRCLRLLLMPKILSKACTYHFASFERLVSP